MSRRCSRRAGAASAGLRRLADETVDQALRETASRLERERDPIIEANLADIADGRDKLAPSVLDRLRLDPARIENICSQLRALADLPPVDPLISRSQADGVVVEVRRIPVGTIGANFEARANVAVDIASQLIKSRNAGVLRTGSAALRTACAMIDLAIAPSLEAAGASAQAIGLVRIPAHEAASALVSLPQLLPLVILRGSGETTARLGREAAAHGVRTLAHAEGGGVLYVHSSGAEQLALELIERGLDRLGVCNRLNLLLIDRARWQTLSARATERLTSLGIASSLPPHEHPLGHEWATDPEHADTVTLAPVDGLRAGGGAGQPGDLRPGGHDRRRGPAGGGRVHRRLPRHGRVLERDDTAARRLSPVPGTGDGDQHRPRAGPRGPATVPRPAPAASCDLRPRAADRPRRVASGCRTGAGIVPAQWGFPSSWAAADGHRRSWPPELAR